ncbi:Ras family protein [Teladorsagia circumcincta]|uniref:Ras family protein n=1 Tax=Teladorsagia circumcincta TaxID=45464 RepID=A0A2G9TXW1_TELCI|nr:Ras family protein [Teladorsagia circumcincta]
MILEYQFLVIQITVEVLTICKAPISQSAGKSAIMKKFFDGVFNDDTAATIGIDFRHITYQLQDGTLSGTDESPASLTLFLWGRGADGQQKVHNSKSVITKQTNIHLLWIAAVVVYGYVSYAHQSPPNIVEQIARWTFFAEREREDGALVVLVGSKCDLKQRRHDKFIMDRMMAEYNASYVETSAKTGFNINEGCTQWQRSLVGGRRTVVLKKTISLKK